MAEKIKRYNAFWLHYLREHARPRTRQIHFVGTFLAVVTVVAAVVLARPWLGIVALVAGYGPAWYAHFCVEKNQPATFTYPIWSLISDFRMAFAWLTGSLAAELARAAVEDDSKL
ncbi:MAG: DUF962 domain-containing protein [Rhizomicrobium sp.]|nr:DUF962 domain-containing protein [Rhizomicrobium sp.]